jgi:hypothetical protein
VLLLAIPIGLLLLDVYLRFGGESFSSAPLLAVTENGETLWRPNRDFYTQLYGSTVSAGQDWDTQAFAVSAQPKEGVCRIIVLGESAAAGDPPDNGYSFSRVLTHLLHDAYPDRQFEVLNLARPAIDSYCLREVVRESARLLNPDLYIFYIGNNELTGAWGYVHPLSALVGESTGLIRANMVLKRDPLVRGMLQGLEAFVQFRAEADPRAAADFLSAPDRTARRVTACYGRFEENLRSMHRDAASCGAKILACTVMTNLRDWEPFRSWKRHTFPES